MSSDLPFEGLGINVPVVNFAGTYLVGTPERRRGNLRRTARAAGWDSRLSPADQVDLMGPGGVDLWGLGATNPVCPPGPISGHCQCPKGTAPSWSDAGYYLCAAVPQSDGSFLDSVTDYIDASAKVLDLICRTTHWGCPGGAAGGGGVAYPPGWAAAEPWYTTPVGIVGILLGVAAVGTGVYLVARK